MIGSLVTTFIPESIDRPGLFCAPHTKKMMIFPTAWISNCNMKSEFLKCVNLVHERVALVKGGETDKRHRLGRCRIEGPESEVLFYSTSFGLPEVSKGLRLVSSI